MTSTAIHDIDKTNVPDVSLVSELLHLICKYEEQECIPFITGDTFGFPGLAKKYGLHLVEAKAVQFPPEDERDEDIFDNYDLQLKVKIHADTNVFGSSSDDKNKLLRSTQKWLCGRRKEYMKILDQEVTKSEAAFHEVIANVLVESYIASDFIGDVKDSPFFHDFWNKYMNKIITEGVCYAKNMVPDNLRKSLQKHIDELAQKTPVDYHPNSNDVVRDLVHPALYPYIKGVSKLNKGAKLPPKIPEENSDFWGRNYEESKFQWLPTPFKITSERKCLVQEYINNLDQDIFSDLYRDLESLFEICLPFFEEVWSYAKAMEFFQGDDHDHGDESDESPALEKESVSFSGQELQIIVKIVEYTLQPGQSYEGVWHAEGMSHENIVMTGIYFLDRDTSIEGGDLRFKRAFTAAERRKIFWNVPQDRPAVVNQFAAEGFMPLGYFPTAEGYLLVFPNCHIHKISKMVNIAEKESASRRIVVFFFVNPERSIMSTKEVPPQPNIITLKSAKDYRLDLMAERKYDKEKLNVRDIELCEH